jgi:hypothetical protein
MSCLQGQWEKLSNYLSLWLSKTMSLSCLLAYCQSHHIFFLQASSIVSTFFRSYSILLGTIVVGSLHASHLFLILFPFLSLFTSLAIAIDATSEILYGHVWSEACDIHPSWEALNIFPAELKKKDTTNGPFLLQIVFYVLNSL